MKTIHSNSGQSPRHLCLGTACARPGQKAWGQLIVREGAKEVRLPTLVVNGRYPGRA